MTKEQYEIMREALFEDFQQCEIDYEMGRITRREMEDGKRDINNQMMELSRDYDEQTNC